MDKRSQDILICACLGTLLIVTLMLEGETERRSHINMLSASPVPYWLLWLYLFFLTLLGS